MVVFLCLWRNNMAKIFITMIIVNSTLKAQSRVLCAAFEWSNSPFQIHRYSDVIMGAMASQITSPSIFYLIVYSYADQRKHQSSASLPFVRGLHQQPVNSPHKGPIRRKMFPIDDVIMQSILMAGTVVTYTETEQGLEGQHLYYTNVQCIFKQCFCCLPLPLKAINNTAYICLLHSWNIWNKNLNFKWRLQVLNAWMSSSKLSWSSCINADNQS